MKQPAPKHRKVKVALHNFIPITENGILFKHLVCLTLDKQMNIYVNETYRYLSHSNSRDRLVLLERLEEYDLRKEYQNILNINVDDISYDEKSINELRKLWKILIDNNVFEFDWNDDFDIFKTNWISVFKSKSNNLLLRQIEKIDKVINYVWEFQNYSSGDHGYYIEMEYKDYIKSIDNQ